MNTIRILDPETIARNWKELEARLAPAFEDSAGETDLIEYLRRLLSFSAQLWLVEDSTGAPLGVVLTQFLDYSNYRSIHIVACAGSDIDSWIHLFSEIEEFAKKNNCKEAESWGRAGWARYLPLKIEGFKKSYTVMRKTLK
jgi:hypothetical protein